MEVVAETTNSDLPAILVAKGTRVFVFGLASIMIPVYLGILAHSPFYTGIALGAIVEGGSTTFL